MSTPCQSSCGARAITHRGRTSLQVVLPYQFAELASYTFKTRYKIAPRLEWDEELVPVDCVKTLVHEEGDTPDPVHPVWWSGCTTFFGKVERVIVQQSRKIHDDETETGERDLLDNISQK